MPLKERGAALGLCEGLNNVRNRSRRRQAQGRRDPSRYNRAYKKAPRHIVVLGASRKRGGYLLPTFALNAFCYGTSFHSVPCTSRVRHPFLPSVARRGLAPLIGH